MSFSRVIKNAFAEWLSMKQAELRHGSHRWTVLCFHEVMDRQAFVDLLNKVDELYGVVSLSEGFESLRSGAADRPLLTLTFDDADKTVWENCLPELRRRRLPASLFVCTGFVDAGFREVSTGRYSVMSWNDLKDWAEAGLEVGSHTVNHIPLNQATIERSKWEILESKQILEKRLGVEVRSIAYPWGYYTANLDDWLQKDGSFATICTTIPRDNYPGDRGKHIYRKPAPQPSMLRAGLKNPTLYETVRAAHQQSVLRGLAPVVWR